MNGRVIFSVIIFVIAVVSYAYFRLWQGTFAGKNYMRNEFGIEEDDFDDDKNNSDN